MAKDIGSLRTKLSFEKTGDSNITDLTRDLKGLRSEMNVFRSSSRAFRTSTQGMRQEADILSRRFEVQKEKVAELKRRYDEAKNATGENSAKTKDLAAQYNNAQAEMNKTQQQLDRLNQMIKTQESRWTKLGNVLDKSGQKLQNAGRSITSFGRSYTMRVTTPILGAAAAALKVGMDFEEGMSKVQAVSGASGKDLEALTEKAKELGANTKFSATEASEGLYYMALAGWETQEMLDGLPGVLDLAAASGEDLGKTSDIVTDGLSAFNMTAKESGRFADVLAAASANANTDVSGLGAAFQYVGPVAGALGFTIEDTAKAIGLMSNAGVKGQKAGTALRTMLTNLASPTDAMTKKMDELGINITDSSGEMKTFDEIMIELRKSFSTLSEEQQAQAASTIFGKNAMSGALAIINASDEDYKKLSKSIKDSEGASAEMAAVMQDNAKGAMIEFKSALEGAGIAVAEHLIPAITDITRKATELVGKFGDLDKEQQQQILKWAGIAAAVGPASIVLGQATTAFGGLLRVGGSVSKMLGRASGAGLIGRMGLMGGPAGVAVLATAGVVGLGTALYKLHSENNKTVGEVLEHVQARKEEIDTLDKTISAYEELQTKNKLTSDEVLRYMDTMSELKNAKTEDAIKALEKEQAELLKKSGMTNDEMEQFLALNDDIVSKTPESTQTISEHGNAYAGTADEVRKLNEAERERLAGETQLEITGFLHSQKELIKDQSDLQDTLKDQENKRLEMIDDLNARQEGLNELSGNELRVAEKLLKADQKNLAELEKRIDKTKDKISENDKELKQFNELLATHEALVLSEVGLVSEFGKGNEAIKVRQTEIEKAKKKLDEKNKSGKIGTDEYKKQNRELDAENEALERAKKKLDEMNQKVDSAIGKEKTKGQNIDNSNKKTQVGIGLEKTRTQEAGKSVVKDVKATDRGTVNDINKRATESKTKSVFADDKNTIYKLNIKASESKNKNVNLKAVGLAALNRVASSPVTKFVNFVTSKIPGLATGGIHKGGLAMVGEEGSELINFPSGKSILSPGTHTILNMPRGTEVIPHKETMSILKNIPRYAEGTNNWQAGEMARLLRRYNQTPSNQTVINRQPQSNNNDALLQATLKQNELLTLILQKDPNITINKRDMVDTVNELNAIDSLGKVF